MGIKQDAGEILYFMYEDYVKDRNAITPKTLLRITNWQGSRIDKAIKYLKDIGAISIVLTMGNVDGVQNFIFRGITPIGIDIIEDKQKFNKNFGFEINLGIFKYSWGASQNNYL